MDRAFLKDRNLIKRLVIKVGSAVVTEKDGGIARQRLQVLCDKITELRAQEYEVILVTSGAVALGRQALRDRKSVHYSSSADLQKPVELNGKACAAVGQPDLMALFKTLFSEDVVQAQCLVTESDFRGKDFLRQLKETVEHLLSLKTIALFNENDAVSTRTDPYEDSSGIFWDNDSLAALLAKELKADLLILMSDVEGVYSGPPSDINSHLIYTYTDRHQGEITFGEKSRVGRGGMAAKVKAATDAASAGIPVVITSGFDGQNITKVLQGERVGTLFPRGENTGESLVDNAREMAVAAKDSSRRLQALTSEERKRILLDIADALEGNAHIIHVENEADVCEADQAGYEKSLISRLALNPGKISRLANNIRVLASMEDPIGRLSRKTQIADDGLILEKISCPLGVVLVIFESRPDALVQMASLAIRSGNGLLLKGGKEAKRSNTILHKIITDVIPERVGRKLIGLVTSRDDIPDLLKRDDNLINLVIPRGSNKLVSEIKNLTKIPVLGHAGGLCHVYIDRSAKMDMAKQIVLDAKVNYPAACNAMETLLIHKELVHTADFKDIILELSKNGVTLYGGPRASSLLNIPQADSLHMEYGSMACTVEVVDDVHGAIEHINKNGR
ncbi:delta-1-pyrroline-5-carboxylate synthase-like [Argentina anserina]|uniref:delta-1-pyrroline-5-carboxylate synthase-like n=1 Tax=Argentina anserina TaxID=57926 RepID=UPI0021765FE6|nr:delta-1-pyrroline-5-carboxylate synthase-like [Potentilla anserina]